MPFLLFAAGTEEGENNATTGIGGLFLGRRPMPASTHSGFSGQSLTFHLIFQSQDLPLFVSRNTTLTFTPDHHTPSQHTCLALIFTLPAAKFPIP